jgi:hypothetical protein
MLTYRRSEMVLYVPLSMEGQAPKGRTPREEGSPGTEEWRIVVSKTQSLRWLENLKRSQRLTAREEWRKEEVMEIFRELYDLSLRHQDPSNFPPWRPSW